MVGQTEIHWKGNYLEPKQCQTVVEPLRHKTEYSAVQYVTMKVLTGANLSKLRLTWLNQAGLDNEEVSITLQLCGRQLQLLVSAVEDV